MKAGILLPVMASMLAACVPTAAAADYATLAEVDIVIAGGTSYGVAFLLFFVAKN